MTTIALAESDAEIERCYPVMAELTRPLGGEAAFLERVRRQMREGGYRLVFMDEAGAVVAVAGFRVSEWLARGKAMYVDDLVTAGAARSRGHGGALLDWLAERARAEGCTGLHLDSGLQRGAAQRFYMAKGMEIRAFHFRLPLQGPGDGQGE
jgi:GNAT superfamily N-acetyltransferase